MTRQPMHVAAARMSDTTLRKASTGFLASVYRDLRKEGNEARTDEAYAPIRAQIARVRAILTIRPDYY